jgi:hypothetical protein
MNTENTNRNNNSGGSVGKSYSHVRVTPGQRSWNCSRRERVQARVQRLKSGPIQYTPTEEHAGLEASMWQPHH